MIFAPDTILKYYRDASTNFKDQAATKLQHDARFMTIQNRHSRSTSTTGFGSAMGARLTAT